MRAYRSVLVVCLGGLLAGCAESSKTSNTTAPGEFKSGPQVGKAVPGPFEPYNVTGASAGRQACQFCRNGENPVAMVFARDLNPEVVKLIKKIDACTAKHEGAKMGSFVVFLSDDDSLKDRLTELAQKEHIDQCVLTMYAPPGPKKYEVHPDAEVTVVLYKDETVKANYAFKKDQLQDKDIDRILADTSKILPSA
jgi:hypothetical protein